MKPPAKYKVTGILTNGRRFKAIYTDNLVYAFGINLYRGTVWHNYNGKWHVIKRVWN